MLITDGGAKMSTAHLDLRLIHNSLQMNEYIINVMKRFFKNNLTSVSKGTIVTGQGFCSNLSVWSLDIKRTLYDGRISQMQEHRSCAAIRSWYRAQQGAARRDRNVEGTSSQCTLLHLPVHWDIISSFYDVTSFAGQILIQGVIQDRKVELTS